MFSGAVGQSTPVEGNRRPVIYLVGGGPGDPDLLAVKALRLLQRADVVLYDRLISAEVLACINPAAELVDVGKEEGQQCEVQRRIVPMLIEYASRFETVVRLKSGDPMVFARGGEELSELTGAGCDVEVVPGISSALAAPVLAGIPLTYRGVARSFAIATGHGRDGMTQDWSAYSRVETLIILMGVGHRAEIAKRLIAAGRDANQPVAFIERASTPTEHRVFATLGDVAAGLVEVEAPAVWVLGEVVALANRRADENLVDSRYEAPPRPTRASSPGAVPSGTARRHGR
jgi:uroporphyrin-III C-methyltransferase